MSLLAGEPARLVTLFEKVYYKQTATRKDRREGGGGEGERGRKQREEENGVGLLLLWTVCAARVLQCVPPVSSGAVPIFFVFFRRAHAEPASLASAFKVRQVHACPVASSILPGLGGLPPLAVFRPGMGQLLQGPVLGC